MSEDKMVQATSEPGPSDVRSPFQFGTWYPIERAPKDGRDVLCYVDGFGMGQMVLYFTDGLWREKANGLGLKYPPKKWMPLPPPPIEEKGE